MLKTKLRKEIFSFMSELAIILTFLIFLFFLFKTDTLRINENVFIKDLINNWENSGIKEIYIPKENETCKIDFFLRTWEGTTAACDCRSSYHYGVKSDIFSGKCSFVQIAVGCKEIPSIDPQNANIWKGSKLCVKKHEINFFDTLTIIGDKCPKKYHLCGVDTKNFNLCFPKKFPCPINKIKINNSNLSVNEKNIFAFETLKLNEDWFLHYSNKFNNDSMIIDVKYSEGRLCVNPSEDNLKNYMKFKKLPKNLNSNLNNQNEKNNDMAKLMKNNPPSQLPPSPLMTCFTKIGKFNYDDRYKSIDSVSKFKFYSDNNIMPKLEKLPQLNSQDLITYNSYLYQRSYIHWSPYCREDKDLSSDAIVNDLVNISTIDGYFDFIRFYSFFIFSFYLMLILLNTLINFIPKKLNFIFNNLFFILLVSIIPMMILLIFILNDYTFIIKKFVSQKCGDYTTNMNFNDIGKNLSELLISSYQIVLITIILITILAVNKLVK